MIDLLSARNEPEWLRNLTTATIQNQTFPLRRLLRDSLYYPASGFDGNPIRHLAGNIHSFIYADYGHERDEFDRALHDEGFRGYEILAEREVTEQELAPHGWRPIPPSLYEGRPKASDCKAPFCLWVVLQRLADMPPSHGPERFSLLYLCADGAAAFQALYVANKLAPRAIAIIQPGHGFGGNYTDFTDPERILARSVLGNPAGAPRLLLYGGWFERKLYREPCWPGYRELIRFLEIAGGGSIGVWMRPS
ncbi:MAG: hypothetical protein QG662_731 [Pseudomonadota bacterium]|nr:hypothetical protein [Pseudomonadota bacterium]